GVAQAVNSALVLLYWQVGHRIRTEILQEMRADYGEQIVPTLSAQLSAEFGDGFSRRNLFRMIRFAEVFPDRNIVAALSQPLVVFVWKDEAIRQLIDSVWTCATARNRPANSFDSHRSGHRALHRLQADCSLFISPPSGQKRIPLGLLAVYTRTRQRR